MTPCTPSSGLWELDSCNSWQGSHARPTATVGLDQ